MLRRPRLGGSSLALRLSAIALVPTIALASMSYGRIQHERMAADVSADIVQAVSLQRDAAELIAPAIFERIALEGLAVVDELGVDRELVTSFTGLDFEVIYEENKAQLDAALRDLGANHSGLTLPDGTLLDDRVATLTAGVTMQRAASDERLGRSDDIVDVFESIDDLIAQVLVIAVAPDGTTAEGIQDLQTLRSIAAVASSGGELTQSIMSGLLYSPSDRRDRAVAASAAHMSSRAAFIGLPGDNRIGMFESLAVPELPLELVADDDGPAGTIATDPAVVATLAVVIEDQITYLTQLHDYSVGLHDTITADALARADEAERSVVNTLAFFAVIAALSLALTAFVLLTTARPLARLSRRAADVSDGDFSAEPLPLAGPTPIRRLTATVNDMLVTLTSVDQQIARMSSGEPGAAADIALPGPIGVSIRRSVERLSGMTAQLTHQARHDLLTSLPNRFAAMEHLDTQIDNGSNYALLFIDLDGFKAINDTMGHDAGDEVLCEVARRLSRSMRPTESVYRLGGDEFVAIMSEFDTVDAVLTLGERLIREIEQPYGSGDEIFALSASVGVVTPQPGVPARDVLQQADSALYLAKRSGRGRVERFEDIRTATPSTASGSAAHTPSF